MDASNSGNFTSPRPDICLGDCHYRTADNMNCRLPGGMAD